MKRVLALFIASLALVAAGCGDDDNGGSESSGSSSGSTATESSSSSSSSSSAAQSGDVAVEIKGFAFLPKDLTVDKGAKITWTNEDTTDHNVVANDDTFKSESLGQGDAFSYTADKAGTYEYVCTFHPNMTATLTVNG